jgi:hypothetical protein
VLAVELAVVISIRHEISIITAKGKLNNVFDRRSLGEESVDVWR